MNYKIFISSIVGKTVVGLYQIKISSAYLALNIIKMRKQPAKNKILTQRLTSLDRWDQVSTEVGPWDRKINKKTQIVENRLVEGQSKKQEFLKTTIHNKQRNSRIHRLIKSHLSDGYDFDLSKMQKSVTPQKKDVTIFDTPRRNNSALDNIVDRIKLKHKGSRQFRSLSPSAQPLSSVPFSECLIVKKPEITPRNMRNKSLSPVRDKVCTQYQGLLVKKAAKKFLKKFKEMYTFVVQEQKQKTIQSGRNRQNFILKKKKISF